MFAGPAATAGGGGKQPRRADTPDDTARQSVSGGTISRVPWTPLSLFDYPLLPADVVNETDRLPLPVEITNHSAWWQAFVPPLVGLLGSIIVAAAAFIGVVLSNRTNERAIDAADGRDSVRWRRDKLLELADEVLKTSEMTTGRLRGCVSWKVEDASGARRTLFEVNNQFATIPMLGRRITFVTDAVEDEVEALFDSLSGLFLLVADRWKDARRELNKDAKPTLDSIDKEAEKVRAAQRAFVLAVRRAAATLGDLRPLS